MCGRYASILTPELIAQVFGTVNGTAAFLGVTLR
jgi:hypothetical protein